MILMAGVLLGQASPLGMTAAAADTSAPPLRTASDQQRRGPANFADLAEKVAPAVICVTSKVTVARQSRRGLPFRLGPPGRSAPHEDEGLAPDQGDRQGGDQDHVGPHGVPGAELTSVGSGFFISADGYAVTNGHVVEDTDVAEIRTSDGKTYTAKVVGRDSLSDLALIKVDGRNDFKYVTIADRPPRTGDWVLAVGNSFGLGISVMRGIVSAHHRNIPGASAEGLIQIDAPINKGDSGGPSVDTDGNVVGVNSMIFSPSGGSVGIAFAIPADTIRHVIPQLRDKGRVTRGSIGITVQTLTPDLAESLGRGDLHGAIIAGAQPGSPAAKAGLISGDVITSIGGQPVKDADDLAKKVRDMAPGSSARLGLFRHGNESSVSVMIAELASRQTDARAPRRR
jgi:serine protease Do